MEFNSPVVPINRRMSQEQPQTQSFAFGGDKGFAELFCHIERNSRTVIPDGDKERGVLAIDRYFDVVRTGISRIVEQIDDGLFQCWINLEAV